MLGHRTIPSRIRYRKKSAISVIIGALILIVIAVGTAVAAYAYFSNAIGGMGLATNNLIGNSGSAVAEQLNIAYTSFNLTTSGPSNAGAAISIQNFGTNPVSVSAVYVQNDATGALVASLLLPSAISIQPGAFQSVAIDFTPISAIPYKITIVTLLGSQFSTVAMG